MRALASRLRDDEDGSVLILALGYFVIAVVLVLVCVDGEGEAVCAGVYDQAEELLAATQTAELVAASAPDGVSARVTVATTWRPPVLTLFVPDGWPLQATATSRTALD